MNIEIDEYIRQKHYRLINSVLFFKENELIVQRYYNNYGEFGRNNIKSIIKSITSICAGISLDKGYIKSFDEPIANYLEEFNQGIHIYHKLITIRHLLTMSSGIYWNGGVHYHCPMLEQLRRSGNWLEHIADIEVANVPGTRFQYKEWDLILLSAVISKATGMELFEFSDQYLYQPLGIKSGKWWRSQCGVTYTIGKVQADEDPSNLMASELAKIGFLMLNHGKYKTSQIVSENYVKQATTPSHCNPGYGFMWWIGEDWFGARGYAGQEIRVFPKTREIAVMQAKINRTGQAYEDVIDFIRTACSKS